MSAPEPGAKRAGGLGGLIAATKSTPASAPPIPAAADAIVPPYTAPPPLPKTAAETPQPMKVGNVAVATDRRGRRYVQKTCNVPLDLAIWIHEQLGTFRRREDGEVTHQFQDVMIDIMYAGRAAIEEKKTATE
jgi:hypothetical protein